MIMEAESSHDLPSIIWRPRKSGGVVSVQTRRPENQGSQWCKSQSESEGLSTGGWGCTVVVQVRRSEKQECWCWQAGENGCCNSSREQIHASFVFLFYSGPQWIGWCPPAVVWAIFFTQSNDSNANLFQKHPHRCFQKLCFTSYLGIP